MEDMIGKEMMFEHQIGDIQGVVLRYREETDQALIETDDGRYWVDCWDCDIYPVDDI